MKDEIVEEIRKQRFLNEENLTREGIKFEDYLRKLQKKNLTNFANLNKSKRKKLTVNLIPSLKK
jgi:hypothetical protein